MRRFDIIALFLTFSLGTLVFFQNCSEMKAESPFSSVNTLTDSADSRIEPDFLINQLIPLDNKVYTGSISYSIGGAEVFTYETDYLATYESTLVKIRGENNQAIIEVIADNCKTKKNLTDFDINSFSLLFSDSYSNSQQKVLQANETMTPGCRFPRLTMDATGLNGDVEIYYSSQECVPTNDLFISDNTVEGQTIKSDIQIYFKNHIDQMCVQ